MPDALPTSAKASARLGRLGFRPEAYHWPGAVQPGAVQPGLRTLESGARPAHLYLPPGLDDHPGRLVVLLHGAGGRPESAVRLLLPFADRARLVLLAPASAGSTWDMIAGGLGPDVRTIDALLEEAARLCPLEAFSVGGFSDGASYALSLGAANGDVFESVLAFSPGFMANPVRHGAPRFFVSHGVRDAVLPIDMCSRRLVPRLRRDGYDVTYEEFPDGHEVPAGIAAEAVRWLTEEQPSC